MPEPASRPLFVVADSTLLDRLLALSASVGIEPELVPDAAGASSAWLEASLIVLDAEAARECARLALPRRGGVVLLAGDPEPIASGTDATEQLWQLASALDADHVVQLPAAAAWLAERLSSAAHSVCGMVIGVVGGRGGAGASMLSCALAVTASQLGHRTMLVDADPLGGGLDVLLGRERYEEARWPDIARESTATVGDIYDVLPRIGELSLLSWDRGNHVDISAALLRKVIDVAKRGCDVVVIDLPRTPDDAAKTAVGLADCVIVVVPAEVRSVASAARVIDGIRPYCEQIRAVVRFPSPAGLKPEDVAAALQLRLLGVMRYEPALALAVEKGIAFARPRKDSLNRLSESVLEQLLVVSGAESK